MIRIDDETFLVVDSGIASEPSVRVVSKWSSAVADWTATTRISPVFGCSNELLKTPPVDVSFEGESRLCFVGPVHPNFVAELCDADCHFWVSLGLLNVVVRATLTVSDRIEAWAADNQITCETWCLSDGRVTDVRSAAPRRTEGVDEALAELAALVDQPWHHEMSDAITEYTLTMSVCLMRSAFLPEEQADEMVSMARRITSLVASWAHNRDHYEAHGAVVTLNAGLSRFTSQTFSGVPPLLATESHLWSHSLLGIGVASLGLRSLLRFLNSSLSAARIPERVLLLEKVTNFPNLRLRREMQLVFDTNYLGDRDLDEAALEPIVPDVAFFSGREGYHGTQTTISAPLTCVASCNDAKWSLLTLTHEVSHVVMRAVQAKLYPDFEKAEQLDHCLALMEPGTPVANLLDEMRRALLTTACLQEMNARNIPLQDGLSIGSHAHLTALLQRWANDINETMVCVFDFLYFYGRDVDKYVTGIWTTWGVIPNVSSRITDYLVRTICAVWAVHLRKPGGLDLAMESVRNALTALHDSGNDGRYVDEAIAQLETGWADFIRRRVQDRYSLVVVVAGILFSETIATKVRQEEHIAGGASDRDGYPLDPRVLDDFFITNPLHFIEEYSVDHTPSSMKSMWMYQVLAHRAGGVPGD